MKKKLDKMSKKEILEEFNRGTEEIEKLAPKVVGDLIRRKINSKRREARMILQNRF